ncbi:MAG TPA: dockerin type I domain-containing protein [Isosphaeraceae bacterium]|nr:dockerin type I domain-containing protein [Isosphaeraceae bacterium]
MSSSRWRFSTPHLERLETRLQMSVSPPANTIGITVGSVTQPGGISSASVTVAPRNLTAGKTSTLFGIFVQPESGSRLAPRIVGVFEGNGQKLLLKQGRPYVAGRDDGQAAAFVKVDRAGPLTILVAGQHQSTGTYQAYVTLAGDVNGDGTVNLADLTAFAAAYETGPGNPNYNAAADFNQSGLININDAKALMQNMTPLTPDIPLQAVVNLLPADQAHYAASKNSGGSTFQRDVTIVGHTTPGSLVITDSKASDYSFTGAAVATNASGSFEVKATNKDGINNNDFLILDPFHHQLVRDFPIFWISFAAPGSKLK